MTPPFHRPDIARVLYQNRSYDIAKGVFNPQVHLSGLVLASHLSTFDWSGKKILELGTGCGLLAGVFADRGASVVATDVSDAAVRCAAENLRDTSVDVRQGDLLEPVANERFDLLFTNPPYEIGRSWRPRFRSPDFLERLAAQWPTVADEIILAFPTDSVDVLTDVGFSLELRHTIPTEGRDLGVFGNPLARAR